MKKKMSRLFSGVLAAVMAVGMLPAYAELDVGADVDVVDNQGTSQAAVIDSAPAQFNVIVPTKLPFAILANNETLKATNAAIKNQGNGPVKLAGITAEGKGWAFGDYDNVDFTKMPMNSKVFTMQLNGDKVPEAAVDTKVNVPITQSAWASGAEGSIYGKTDLPISYDGKFAPQADASEEAVVAHVVFTIGWQTADDTTAEPQIVEGEYGNFTYRIANNKATITGLSESGKVQESITEMPDSIDGVPVTVIGQDAFAHIDGQYKGCNALALTSLPSGVSDIEKQAFYNCANLALTSLPEGLTSVGDSAFAYCKNIAIDSVPESLITIENSAFYGCPDVNITSIPGNQYTPVTFGGTKCEFPDLRSGAMHVVKEPVEGTVGNGGVALFTVLSSPYGYENGDTYYVVPGDVMVGTQVCTSDGSDRATIIVDKSVKKYQVEFKPIEGYCWCDGTTDLRAFTYEVAFI